MFRAVLLSFSLLFGLTVHASVSLADDAATIEEIKHAVLTLDEAFAHQDKDLIESMVTSNHQAATAYYGRVVTIAEQIATLDEFKASLHDVTAESVDLLGDGAAVVTFEKSYEGTYMGKTLPDRVFTSAIWEKVDGKWRQRLYQETVIKPGQ